jgi:hypothetical protein
MALNLGGSNRACGILQHPHSGGKVTLNGTAVRGAVRRAPARSAARSAARRAARRGAAAYPA